MKLKKCGLDAEERALLPSYFSKLDEENPTPTPAPNTHHQGHSAAGHGTGPSIELAHQGIYDRLVQQYSIDVGDTGINGGGHEDDPPTSHHHTYHGTYDNDIITHGDQTQSMTQDYFPEPDHGIQTSQWNAARMESTDEGPHTALPPSGHKPSPAITTAIANITNLHEALHGIKRQSMAILLLCIASTFQFVLSYMHRNGHGYSNPKRQP